MLPVLIPAILWLGHQIFGAIEPTVSSVIANQLSRLSTKGNTVGQIVSDVLQVFKNQGAASVNVTSDSEDEFKLKLQSLLGQIDIDKVEAASESRFDSGWRPFLAWGLSSALLMSVLVEPTINYILGFFGVTPPPAFVLSPLVMGLLSGLCGLYMGLRTQEKNKRVN